MVEDMETFKEMLACFITGKTFLLIDGEGQRLWQFVFWMASIVMAFSAVFDGSYDDASAGCRSVLTCNACLAARVAEFQSQCIWFCRLAAKNIRQCGFAAIG
ncbi:MAG: hypothetical protein R3E67_01515 [Pseudomonadales bacterium]